MDQTKIPPEPNLIAESYRKLVVQLPKRFEKHYDFIDINQDGLFLLCTSNITGRIWLGSAWVFRDLSDAPNAEKCIAGLEFDAGIPVGKWFEDGKNIVIGSDSGAINILSLTSMNYVKKNYLSTVAIVSEHDDIITAIDITSDNTTFLSGSMDMNIKLWDSETVTCERTYEYAHAHTVTSACFQPGKSDVFISTSLDGSSLIWDTKLDKPASLILKTDSGYTASCWIDDNCIALGANAGSVSLVDMRMKSELDRNFCSKRPIYYMKYDTQTELLAVSADDPLVRVFSCTDNLLNNIYECDRHEDFVRGLTWKEPGQLYTCGWDKKILLHEIMTNSKSSEQNSTMEANGGDTPKDEEEKEK